MPKPAPAQSVDAYLDQLPEPRRSEIRALHEMIRRAVPQLAPSIQSGMIGYGSYHYKYESGREGDCAVVSLSSRANYISVYVGATENGEYIAEKYKAELPNAVIGKSCIRFKSVADIDLKVLEKLVKLCASILTQGAKA